MPVAYSVCGRKWLRNSPGARVAVVGWKYWRLEGGVHEPAAGVWQSGGTGDRMVSNQAGVGMSGA